VLPLPPGFRSGFAIGVNAKGQIVGAAFPNVGGGADPIRWDPGAAPVDLGILQGHVGSVAVGISDAGDAVGTAAGPALFNPPLHAVRWPAEGGIQDLGESWSEGDLAIAINKRGDAAWIATTATGFDLHLLRNGVLTVAPDADKAVAITQQRLTMNHHDDVAFGAFVWSSQSGWTLRSSPYFGPRPGPDDRY